MAIKGELFKDSVKLCDVRITRLVEGARRYGTTPAGGGKPVGLAARGKSLSEFTLVGPESLAGIGADTASAYALAPIGKTPLPIRVTGETPLAGTPPTVEVSGVFG